MVDVAQLVRALVCGTRGRGFESHLPPKNQKDEGIAKAMPFLHPTGPLQTRLHKGQEGQKRTAIKLSLIF